VGWLVPAQKRGRIAHPAGLRRPSHYLTCNGARRPSVGRLADQPLVAAVVVAFAVLPVVTSAAGVAAATDERAVDVDVVEDRETEVVRSTRCVLALVEDDGDALDLTSDGGQRDIVQVAHQRTTPAEPEPTRPERRHARGRRVAPDGEESIARLHVEARRARAAV